MTDMMSISVDINAYSIYIYVQWGIYTAFLYTPGTPMTSIFEGQPPPKQGLFQQKQGSFGFHVYIYIYVFLIERCTLFK